MNSTLITWIFIALGIVVLSALALLYVLSLPPAEFRSLSRAWGETARRTRLNYTPPKASIEEARLHGIHRQREIAAAVRQRTAYSLHGQQELRYYTRLEAYLRNPERFYLRVSTKGSYRKTDQLLGQPVRPLGDHQIDNRYDIKCIPPDFAARLVAAHKPLRDGLLAMRRDRYIELELEGNAVRVEEEDIELNPTYLLQLVELLCAIGETFEHLG